MDKKNEMDKIVNAALRNNGYYFDLDNSRLIVTKKFKNLSSIYNSTEYNIVEQLIERFGDIEIKELTSKKKVSKYHYMEAYIKMMPDAKANLEEFKNIKQKYEKLVGSYDLISDWFKTKYPYYESAIVRDENREIIHNNIEAYQQAL